jgi:hypothetical protein
MEITLLFWNIRRNPIEAIVAELARRHEVDILILAESNINPAVLLETLNAQSTEYHFSPQLGCRKIQLYSRFETQFIKAIFEHSRITVRRLNLPGLIEILIVMIHMPSKRNWSADSQGYECNRIAEEIRILETQVGHSRTILVGDLNMNPFDHGTVSARGFHAVMSQAIAREGKRTVQGVDYPFFYNPMWNHFGDTTPGMPGTYYFRNAEHKVYFWHILDQVLIRPDLLSNFDAKDLQIPDSVGDTSFLTNGRPNKKIISDHLPLIFRLDL